MSVLFIGKRFYTNRDALREEYGRIWQLPWHWAEAGIDSRLWLVDYHTRETIHTIVDKLPVDSTPVKNLAVFTHWLLHRYTNTARPDVVVASGDCYIGWMASRVARSLHARFVFDVYDKYDEFTGYWTPPRYKLFHKLIREADASIFASRALMDSIGIPGASILVPNGVDPAIFVQSDKYICRTKFNLPRDVTVIGYVGSLSADRGVDDLINAARLVRGRGKDVRVLLAGQCVDNLQQMPDFVIYVGNVPYTQVPAVLSCCDVLALPYRRSCGLDMASSCKIAEYMAMNRPIAATRTPNFISNFAAAALQLAGRLADPSDTEDLARVITLQIEDPRFVALPPNILWPDIAAAASVSLALR